MPIGRSNMPRVSVIMGTYNGEKRIKRAVESILHQTFADFELIICDDGSIDRTYKIVEEMAQCDTRIILIRNTKNKGLAKTLNRCLKLAKGDYIARMDDDDISHPERLEKQVLFLDSNPRYALVGTSRNFFDDKGIWGESIRSGERKKIDIYLGKSFVHPSVMLRREAILAVNGYSTDPGIGRAEDYDLWCKLYSEGYIGYNLGEVLFDYYESRDSYNKRKYKYRVLEYKLRLRWRKGLGLPLRYSIYAYRPLLVGLIPKFIHIKYHKNKFKINN